MLKRVARGAAVAPIFFQFYALVPLFFFVAADGNFTKSSFCAQERQDEPFLTCLNGQ